MMLPKFHLSAWAQRAGYVFGRGALVLVLLFQLLAFEPFIGTAKNVQR